MARYRAGYEADYGFRDFDSHRPRFDVGSRGYDRGYPRIQSYARDRRPWVGGYQEGYVGGSEGIAVGAPRRGGSRSVRYDRGLRGAGRPGGYTRREAFDRGDQGYAGGGGEYDPRYARRGRRPGRYDLGFRPTDEDYRRDLERHRPHFTPVGGMNPAMGGIAAIDHGYDGGWFNEWSRWF